MIKAPSHAQNAIPTERGWVNPLTGELLVSRKLHPAEIKEWKLAQSGSSAPAPAPAPEPIIEADPVVEEAEPEAEPLIEADPDDVDLSSMTKAQLIEWGAEIGIELDSAMTKAEMLSELEG